MDDKMLNIKLNEITVEIKNIEEAEFALAYYKDSLLKTKMLYEDVLKSREGLITYATTLQFVFNDILKKANTNILIEAQAESVEEVKKDELYDLRKIIEMQEKAKETRDKDKDERKATRKANKEARIMDELIKVGIKTLSGKWQVKSKDLISALIGSGIIKHTTDEKRMMYYARNAIKIMKSRGLINNANHGYYALANAQ